MDLHVEFVGDEIVVTQPGTDMMTGYRKAPDGPYLVLTQSGASRPLRHQGLASSERTPLRLRSARHASWIGLSDARNPAAVDASRVSLSA